MKKYKIREKSIAHITILAIQGIPLVITCMAIYGFMWVIGN